MSAAPRADTVSMMKEFLRHLRAGNPEAYLQFCQAFELYAIEAMEGLSAAPPESILNMQGRSQQLQALLRVFMELEKKAPPKPQAPNQQD